MQLELTKDATDKRWSHPRGTRAQMHLLAFRVHDEALCSGLNTCSASDNDAEDLTRQRSPTLMNDTHESRDCGTESKYEESTCKNSALHFK